MSDRNLPKRRLIKILKTFGVEFDAKKGRGSHGTLWKTTAHGIVVYSLPNRQDTLVCYVRGARKKFKLTVQDGVSDETFYGAA